MNTKDSIDHVNQKYTAAVVVTSDSCYEDKTKDKSGLYVMSELMKLPYIDQVVKHIVPDDKDKIVALINSLLDSVELLITCGGTGLCPRDVTPEATQSLYHKSCPGIATLLMMDSIKKTPHAALSRLSSGIVESTLIVNFPGKLIACQQCFESLKVVLQHALEQVKFNPKSIKKTHLDQDKTDVNNGMKQLISTNDDHTNYCKPIGDSSTFTNHRVDSQADITKSTIKSMYKLVKYEDALEILKQHSTSVLINKAEVIFDGDKSLSAALGSTLADHVKSKTIIPETKVSTMDGYVLNLSQNMANKVKSIGSVHAKLVKNLEEFSRLRDENSFFCYQVNTGGSLPIKNFAVIPFEDSGPSKFNGSIPIYKIQPGRFIREIGSDMDLDYILKKGTKLGPVELVTLITMGHRSLHKLVKPTIGIISTGDEIVNPFGNTTYVNSNQVVDVNNSLLRLLFQMHDIPCIDCGLTKDNPKDILDIMRGSLDKCDVLIVTGGASMGTRDYVKGVIVNELKGKIHFGRVDMKPGRPVSFATVDGFRSEYIFSLPGNPVSAYITSLIMVIPFIKYSIIKYLGQEIPVSFSIIGTIITVEIGLILDLESSVDDKAYKFDGRLEFVRAKLLQSNDNNNMIGNRNIKEEHQTDKSRCLVSVSAKQQSSRLLSLMDFDCLIMVHPEMKGSRFLVGQTYQAVRLMY